ncbi:glycoside hydrolase family 31 protein [Vibrio sp. TH_r3]|uniref:glycoside hydrolase family 31 protein n=1 Tax=Vibrio sp. TH_r3 TaxID=3082084 RepID=UPI00295330DA|nr:glycoside hydrolase family 31 protein [Vibrio sp. TH_r3]MDV7104634.1 glycoside hydrolase family 31 protein [Vibrio sp. TH_r3]
MKNLKNWSFKQQHNNEIVLSVDEKHSLHLFVLESNLIRVLIKRHNVLRLDRTWMVAPDGQDVPWQGRDRMSTKGFSLPSYALTNTKDKLIVATDTLRLTLNQPLWMEWEHKINGEWQPLTKDRKTGAFQLGVTEPGISHFMNREDNEYYYGLGEKTGNLNREGRRFEMRNLDAMGYDASKTDPLYKHVPFYITKTNTCAATETNTRSTSASFGVFYDNLANCWFDLGNELDNYHIKYRSYRAEDGDLDLYFMYGDSVKSVTKQFVRLTGGTAFGPKWSLGYSGSTMQYTDAPNSQELLEGFVDQCESHGMPCDSFQLSSGYTSIGDLRYVFNWNYDKVPNPNTMAEHFHSNGLKLAANIKPCLLHSHPRFQEVEQKGLFIKDSEYDRPENSVFWDSDGSHLDFTNPDTVKWWQDNVKEQLLDKGIDSTWNDNNEYEIWDKGARCCGFGKEIPVSLIRPLQPLLMMRASYEAQIQYAPNIRPYLISRSGCPGMNRYVQTWSGDNRTNWTSLKYNIKMGLGMSLSGLYNLGHDVGGFSGEKPDPELFVRWVQNGVMHPRFTIHSWNDDGSVNEPWMHPTVTPIIRDAMKLRYQLLPYIYDALYQAHANDEPMLRPTFLDHEHDENTLEENDDYLLGRNLLVASVVEAGQRERMVYLPNNQHGWYDYYTGQWYSAGRSVIIDAPLERIPLLARAGSIIPTSERIASVNPKQDKRRNLNIYPIQGVGHSVCSLFDDDGETNGYQSGDHITLNIEMRCDNNTIDLSIIRIGHFTPAYDVLALHLPHGESRQLTVNGTTYQNGAAFPLSAAHPHSLPQDKEQINA